MNVVSRCREVGGNITERRKESAIFYGYQFVNMRFLLRFGDKHNHNRAAQTLLNGLNIELFSAFLGIYAL